jgi:hypothetical protein
MMPVTWALHLNRVESSGTVHNAYITGIVLRMLGVKQLALQMRFCWSDVFVSGVGFERTENLQVQ